MLCLLPCQSGDAGSVALPARCAGACLTPSQDYEDIPSALADAAAQELLYRRCALPCLLLAAACLLAGLLLSGWTARLLCLSLSASLWLLTGALYSSSNLAGWRRRRQALPHCPYSPSFCQANPALPTIQRAPTAHRANTVCAAGCCGHACAA
jgi:hypothetical protein